MERVTIAIQTKQNIHDISIFNQLHGGLTTTYQVVKDI
jgi:hypothetical protein